MREMESLYNIFKCVGSDRCKYFENERYCTSSEDAADSEHLVFEECVPGGKVYILIADELLLIENDRSPREKVLIGRFPKDGKCRISYMGDSARSMWKTTEALRLPSSWPTNLGEQVFYIFRGHLEMQSRNRVEPFLIEQRVVDGKKHQFLLVTMKLVHVYDGGKIDSEFYRNYKHCRTRYYI